MRSRSFWLLSAVGVVAACSGDSTSPASGNADGRLQIIHEHLSRYPKQ